MATCPRCKGHLTDSHRCPRSPGKVALEVTLAAVAGGFIGLLVVALLDPHGHATNMDAVSLVGGGLVGVGIDRILRR